MPRSRNQKCDTCVKDVVNSFHSKCDHQRPLVEVFGQYLNDALGTIRFERDKKYCICRYLYRHKVQDAMAKLVQEEIRMKENTIPICMECTNDDGTTANIQQPTTKTRVGFLTKFPIEVSAKCDELLYRKSHMSATNRTRRNRVNDMAQAVIAANVCKSTLNEKGMDYLVNNKSLASDVVIFLDAVKERIIQGVMRINLNDVRNLTIPRLPEEEESAEEKAMNGLVIMNNTTKAGYTALRNILIEKNKYDAESLPSCFKIFKELRPKVDEFLVQPESIFISERRSVVKRKRKSEVLKGEEGDCKQTCSIGRNI